MSDTGHVICSLRLKYFKQLQRLIRPLIVFLYVTCEVMRNIIA